MIRIVCFYLRIIANEKSRVDEHSSHGSQAIDSSSEASSKGSSTESGYNDNDNTNLAGYLYLYYYFLP